MSTDPYSMGKASLLLVIDIMRADPDKHSRLADWCMAAVHRGIDRLLVGEAAVRFWEAVGVAVHPASQGNPSSVRALTEALVARSARVSMEEAS